MDVEKPDGTQYYWSIIVLSKWKYTPHVGYLDIIPYSAYVNHFYSIIENTDDINLM